MDSEVVGSPESTGSWYRDITASQWRVLVAAWGVGPGMNDALDFLAITFVLSDIARTRGVSLDRRPCIRRIELLKASPRCTTVVARLLTNTEALMTQTVQRRTIRPGSVRAGPKPSGCSRRLASSRSAGRNRTAHCFTRSQATSTKGCRPPRRSATPPHT
jgi:hypothetical protein